ncbi:MAG: zinc carboxypeptidase, partial [Oligoflexus sp.]|nr:zinc carboxypeptidase [Pseudopedobacter sp.]
AYSLKDAIKPINNISPPPPPVEAEPLGNAYAWVSEWKSVNDVKFLTSLLKSNIKVRYAESPFEVNGKKYEAGSLIIAKTSNEGMGDKLEQKLSELAKENNQVLNKITSGFVDKGADLGSDKIRFINKPTVAVLAGDEVNSIGFGEIWHFFEQQIAYPLTVIKTEDLGKVKWNDINVLIVPDGNYTDLVNDKVLNWIKAGGKIIAIDGALKAFADKKEFGLKSKEDKKVKEEKDETKKDIYTNLKVYANREREGLINNIPGAIYKLELDNTNPLAFGYPNYYFSLKLDTNIYSFLEKGWNVGYVKKSTYVSGFTGANIKQKLQDGTLFGVEDLGKGSVVYLADDPLFRSFWQNGKLLFSNAVFLVGQ